MAFKRRFTIKTKKFKFPLKGAGKRKTPFRGVSSIIKIKRHMRQLTRTVETKSGVQTFSDGFELGHDQITTYSSTLLGTVQGITDNENSQGTRIGDKITIQSVQTTQLEASIKDR